MQSYKYEILADYYQLYLQDDESGKGDLSDSWTDEAVDRLLAIAPYVVGVGTVRNMEVSVIVEIHQNKPTLEFDKWDHVNHCSLIIETGRIVVAGCTDYFPDAKRIEIFPGTYQVYVCYKNLDKVSQDGLDGEDSYHIKIFPGKECGVETLKQRKSG